MIGSASVVDPGTACTALPPCHIGTIGLPGPELRWHTRPCLPSAVSILITRRFLLWPWRLVSLAGKQSSVVAFCLYTSPPHHDPLAAQSNSPRAARRPMRWLLASIHLATVHHRPCIPAITDPPRQASGRATRPLTSSDRPNRWHATTRLGSRCRLALGSISRYAWGTFINFPDQDCVSASPAASRAGGSPPCNPPPLGTSWELGPFRTCCPSR